MTRKSPSQVRPRWNFLDAILLFTCLLMSFAVCWYFHDKGWLAVDDGYYGYVSQRILQGDVIHRDFQGLHPGMIFLVNTLSLGIAGGDLVGLRYPLIAITIIQSTIGFELVRHKGFFAAAAAVLALTAFGFIQFINPTGNWYALCLAVLLAYLLKIRNRFCIRDIITIGFIVGLTFLFRQYSGAMAAIAVTVVIFVVNSAPENNKSKFVAGRNFLVFLTIILCLFLASSGHITGFIIIGVFPIVILAIAIFRININVQETSRILMALFFGAFLSAIPLIIYHGFNGSLFNWITDLTIENFVLSGMEVFDLYRYGTNPLFAFISIVSGDFGAIGGLIFWSALLLAPTLLGVSTVVHFYKNQDDIPVISIFACFYALVSVIFEAPVYLVYSSGLVFLALLSGETIRRSSKLILAIIAISITAIVFQAGETKQITKFTATNTRLLSTTHLVPGTSIKIGEHESAKYQRLINLVETCSFKSDQIYAFPISPEINFLTNREYPFRSFILMLLLRNDQDVESHVEEILSSKTLALILHDADELYYNTTRGELLLNGISSEYSELGFIEGFTVYHRTEHPKNDACSKFDFDVQQAVFNDEN